MPGMNSLLQAFGLAQDESTQYAANASDILNRQAKAGEDIALDTQEAGRLGTEAAAVKLNGELRAQQAARDVASSLGANPDDAENFKLGMLGQDFWDAYSQARQVRATIAQKSSASFLDNPLQWIWNQATLDGDIQQFNALAGQANMAADAMAQINANVQGAASAQKSIAQTLTEESVKKSLEASALASKIDADKIRQQTLSYNLKALEVVHQTSNEGLTRQFQLHGALMSEASLAISQENLAIARQAASERAAERSEKLSQKEEDRNDLQRYSDVINTARGAQGLPPMSIQEIRMQVKTGGPAAKSKLDQFYTDGAVMLSTGQRVLGENAGQAAATVYQNQSPLNPAMKPVRDFVTQALMDTRDNVLRQNPKAKGEDIVAASNKVIADRSVIYHGDITKNAQNNPYAAPNLNTLAQIPDVANSKFYKLAVAPLQAGGMQFPDPDKIIASAEAAVRDKKMSFQDAQIGIAGLYQAAINSNNSARNYGMMHLGAQTAYNASVSNGSPFGNKDRIDLSNPQHVANLMMRRNILNLRGSGGNAGTSILQNAIDTGAALP